MLDFFTKEFDVHIHTGLPIGTILSMCVDCLEICCLWLLLLREKGMHLKADESIIFSKIVQRHR
jgi:hypothetical protein